MQEFKSNGKILLTGEYAVLNGAKSLALPTKAGQSMEVSKGSENEISWTSYDENEQIWFQAKFEINSGKFSVLLLPKDQDDPEIKETARRLKQILSAAFKETLFRRLQTARE